MSLIHTVHDLEEHEFDNEFLILKDFDPEIISVKGFTLKYEYYDQYSFGIFTNNKFYYMQSWKSNPRFTNGDNLYLSITTSTGDTYIVNINDKNYGAVQVPFTKNTIVKEWCVIS